MSTIVAFPKQQILDRIEELRAHVRTYQNLTATCITLGDHHGVVDAQIDISKLEARIEELQRLVRS